MFASELRNHNIASVNLSISEARLNPKQQKALPQRGKHVTFQPGPFCSRYAPNTGSSSGQKPIARELTPLLPQCHFTLTRA